MDKSYTGQFDRAYDEILQLSKEDMNKAKDIYSKLSAEGRLAVSKRLPEALRQDLEEAAAGTCGSKPPRGGRAPTEPLF